MLQYQKQNLDDLLDDVSGGGIERQRRFYQDFQDRLSALKPEQLAPEDRADLAILQDQTALSLMDLNEIRSHLHNPTFYVEVLGNALFSPYVLDYAPKPKRFQNIINRLQNGGFMEKKPLENWMEVLNTDDESEATIAQGLLESEGMECRAESNRVSQFPVAIGKLGLITVMVKASDFEKAKRLLDATRLMEGEEI